MGYSRRQMRDYMQRRRGRAPGPKSLLEDTQARICLYWHQGRLSEGQAAHLLGLDRLGARELRDRLFGWGGA
jgi:hypothetical protein